MAWFRNHYTCPECGYNWTDESSATCDDDCPDCGLRHVSPVESEDLDTDDAPDNAVVTPNTAAAPETAPKVPRRSPRNIDVWI